MSVGEGKPDRHVSSVNHSACANVYEDRAFELLRKVQGYRDEATDGSLAPSDTALAEAQAYATLAQSHRIAEQTETLHTGLDAIRSEIGVGLGT